MKRRFLPLLCAIFAAVTMATALPVQGLSLDWKEPASLSAVSNASSTTVVYTTKTGTKYHLRKTCSTLARSTTIYQTTRSKAAAKGYTLCKVCGTSGTSGASSAATPKTPGLGSVANGNGYVKFTWKKVSGAKQYYVYRKTGSGGWKKVAAVSSSRNYYQDKKVSSGTTYTYTVRAVNGSKLSGYNKTGKKIVYLATPKLTALTNTASGQTLKWSKVKGAKQYEVYRKVSGKWKKVRTLTGNSTTFTGLTSGGSYTYTVRAVNGKVKSSYVSKGKSGYWLSIPDVDASESAQTITVTWDSVKGAQKYAVYRKTDSSGWKKVATATGTSWTDTTIRDHDTYYYAVRAMRGSSLSAYTSTFSARLSHSLSQQTRKEATCAADGYVLKQCPVCGQSQKTVLSKTGQHDYQQDSVHDTCTERWTNYKCTVCGNVVRRQVSYITQHQYVITRVEPTCTQDGEKTLTCSRCGKTSTTTRSALGHNYTSSITVYPTTENNGKYQTKCTRCGDVSFDVTIGKFTIQLADGSTTTVVGYFDKEAAIDNFNRVNKYRAAAGLSTLKWKSSLYDTAVVRGYEISCYYSHTRPNGEKCYTVFPTDASSIRQGENICAGARTASEAHYSWIASDGHRENILNTDYKYLGVSCFIALENDQKGAKYYWVQCFQ